LERKYIIWKGLYISGVYRYIGGVERLSLRERIEISWKDIEGKKEEVKWLWKLLNEVVKDIVIDSEDVIISNNEIKSKMLNKINNMLYEERKEYIFRLGNYKEYMNSNSEMNWVSYIGERIEWLMKKNGYEKIRVIERYDRDKVWWSRNEIILLEWDMYKDIRDSFSNSLRIEYKRRKKGGE